MGESIDKEAGGSLSTFTALSRVQVQECFYPMQGWARLVGVTQQAQ